MNIFNVAIVTRVFLFFAYPTAMSGDTVWVRTKSALGYAGGEQINGFTGATPLGQIGTAEGTMAQITDTLGNPIGFWDGFLGLIPGSIGETSTLAILLGAVVLLITGVASWKTMFSVFAGGAFMGFIFNLLGFNAVANFPWYMHLVFGGFAFGAVFMATDPVTSARTETGKWIYGFLVGVIAILIRVLNPGYPEGMMLSILLMNAFAPLIDFYVVDANIKRRMKRAQLNK
jgi:Na+-transporting NADH:ubiquinone oxidoreductase subunit B